MTSSISKHRVEGLGNEGGHVFTFTLRPWTPDLIGRDAVFGPVRNPQPVGTIFFATGSGIEFDEEDQAISDFLSAACDWADGLRKIERGDVRSPQDSTKLTHAHLDGWVAEAVAQCPTPELGREVAARLYWSLYPGVEQIVRRRALAQQASSWVKHCLENSESFLQAALTLLENDAREKLVVIEYTLAAYHLLLAAARLENPPTKEEFHLGQESEREGPGDVRLGYFELGLGLHHARFSERLLAWEYALRYKAEMLDFSPNLREVVGLYEAVKRAYMERFAIALPATALSLTGPK